MNTETTPVIVEFECQNGWPKSANDFSGSVRGVYFPDEALVVWQHPTTSAFHADHLDYAEAKYMFEVRVVGEVRHGLHPLLLQSLSVAGVNALQGRRTFEEICEEYFHKALQSPE